MSKTETQKVWMSRCKPGGKHDQLDDCKRDGIIAIGWGGHVDLNQQNWWESDEGKALGGHARGNLRRFSEMKKGDWVVVPRGPHLHFAQITGDNVVNAEKSWAGGRVSYYEANWQDGTRQRSEMPASMQSSLKWRGTHLLVHDDYSHLEGVSGTTVSARMVEHLCQEVFPATGKCNLSPDELEQMIKRLFERMSFQGVVIPSKRQGKPGDVDVYAVTPLGIQVYAQVKFHQGESGTKGVQQLIDRKKADDSDKDSVGRDIYLFITTARLEKDAEELAESNDIMYWDGEALAAKLVEYGVSNS